MSLAGCAIVGTAGPWVWLFASFRQDDAVALQREDLVLCIAVLCQDVIAVLRKFRWRTPRPARRPPQLDRRTDATIPVELGDHLAVRGVRRGGRLIDRQHGT